MSVRPRIANLTGVLYPSRAALVSRGDQIYDAMAKAADSPRSQRAWNTLDSTVEALPKGYDLLKLLVPAIGSALQANDRHTLEIAGTRTVLAIEAFRAEKGRLPATLDELVPGVLAAVPVDPFPLAAFAVASGARQIGWPGPPTDGSPIGSSGPGRMVAPT